MATPITNVTPFNPPVVSLDSASISRPSQSSSDFVGKLREALKSANEGPAAGEKASDAYAAGTQNDLHGTMISMAQADISLRLVSNIRSRVIEAYREVMRMGA